MFKALLPQQGERIFQSGLSPAVLSEVVFEELSHLLIMLRPERRKKKTHISASHKGYMKKLQLNWTAAQFKNNEDT